MRKFYTFIFTLIIAIGAQAQERLIILDEGNFQNDNGRLSYFEDGKIVSNKWFEEVNKKKLGDTPNDIIQINDSLIAIAVNWSNIIQFIRPNGKAVAATEDIPNNRYMATDGAYLYVSSYGHECTVNGAKKKFTKGFVAKIDINTFKCIAATEVGYEPDGIALYKGHLFVANTGGYSGMGENHDYETTVSILDANTMAVTRTVDTKIINLYGHMSQTGQYLCINSAGDYYDNPACSLIFDCDKALNGDYDCFVKMSTPATYNCATRDGKFFVIGSSFSFTTNQYEFSYLTVDPATVFDSEGDGAEESLPGTMIDNIKSMTAPYGIYVNPFTGYIYATEASLYANAGKLYQWDPEGNLKGKYDVYINPGHFLALPPDGMSTSITEVKTNRPDANTIYDLQGRRLNAAPAKGIYIKNGKKIIK